MEWNREDRVWLGEWDNITNTPITYSKEEYEKMYREWKYKMREFHKNIKEKPLWFIEFEPQDSEYKETGKDVDHDIFIW